MRRRRKKLIRKPGSHERKSDSNLKARKAEIRVVQDLALVSFLVFWFPNRPCRSHCWLAAMRNITPFKLVIAQSFLRSPSGFASTRHAANAFV